MAQRPLVSCPLRRISLGIRARERSSILKLTINASKVSLYSLVLIHIIFLVLSTRFLVFFFFYLLFRLFGLNFCFISKYIFFLLQTIIVNSHRKIEQATAEVCQQHFHRWFSFRSHFPRLRRRVTPIQSHLQRHHPLQPPFP